MCKICNRNRFPETPAITHGAARLKRWPGVIVVALFMALQLARAEGPDDQYMRVFNLIQEADALDTGGKSGPALAKYKEAQAALRTLKNDNPGWNAQAVTYRFNYLAEKIAILSQPVRPPATNAAPAAREGQSETVAATPASASAAKLLEAGAEPRQVLRLHPKAGDKQAVGLTMKMAMDISAGGMPGQAMKMPAMKLTLDLTTKNVSADGGISYETVIGDASVADEPGAMPQVVEAMKSAFGGLKGQASTAMMSDRGLSKGTGPKLAAGGGPQLAQVMDQMNESFAMASVQFPEEAVGPGAKWEVKRPMKSQGMTLDQTTTYQLVSLDGERATIKSTVAQHAANQKIESPLMPGMKIDLTKWDGKGSGEVTLDLAQIMPAAGAVESHTEAAMAVNMGNQKQAMALKVDLNIRLETK